MASPRTGKLCSKLWCKGAGVSTQGMYVEDLLALEHMLSVFHCTKAISIGTNRDSKGFQEPWGKLTVVIALLEMIVGFQLGTLKPETLWPLYSSTLT